jgi:hypothetical protein
MVDILEFDKDQLSEYAMTVFDVKLDMRQKLDDLQKQVKALQEKPKKDVVVKSDNPKATHILNRNTGLWFPWTEDLAKHLTNAVPCDENGKPV